MITELGSVAASATAGSSTTGYVSQQGFDGVGVRCEDYETAMRTRLKVMLWVKGQSEVLCDLPLLALAERSDFLGGASFGEAYRENTATSPESEVLPQVPVFVNLGHLELSGDDEVQVTLSVTTALEADGGASFFAVDYGPGEEAPVKLVEKPSGTANFSFPVEVYAFRTAADTNEDAVAEAAAGACLAAIKTGQRSYNFDLRNAWALTAAIGNHSSDGPRRLVNLFLDGRNRNASGEFSAVLTGTDVANWTVIGVERVLLGERAKEKAGELINARRVQLNKLAQRDGGKLQALKAIGLG